MSVRAIGLMVVIALCAACHWLGKGERGGNPDAEVRALLATQTAAWNRGDVAGFMQGYWHSDSVRFASDGIVTRGWQQTLARYQSRYGDKAAMGQLELSELELQLLAPDSACVFGHWKLTRANDQPHGLFTLILKRHKDGWRIVHD